MSQSPQSRGLRKVTSGADSKRLTERHQGKDQDKVESRGPNRAGKG